MARAKSPELRKADRAVERRSVDVITASRAIVAARRAAKDGHPRDTRKLLADLDDAVNDLERVERDRAMLTLGQPDAEVRAAASERGEAPGPSCDKCSLLLVDGECAYCSTAPQPEERLS